MGLEPAVNMSLANSNGICPENTVFINEFHYQNIGPDISEFVEVASVMGYNFVNHSIYFYDGALGTFYKTVALDGQIQVSNNVDGFTFTSFPVYSPLNEVQNEFGAIALVDGSNNVLDFIAYGGEFSATDGPAAGLAPKFIGVEELPTEAPQNSLQLGGTGFQAADFTWQDAQIATSGRPNIGQTIKCGCEDTETYLEVEILADGNAAQDETKVRIFTKKDANGKSIEFEQETALEDNELYSWSGCVPTDSCIRIRVDDTGGDGICCNNGEGYIKTKYGDMKQRKSTFKDGQTVRTVSYGKC